jgi:hypothetical protein
MEVMGAFSFLNRRLLLRIDHITSFGLSPGHRFLKLLRNGQAARE